MTAKSWEPYGALFILVILFLLPAPILAIVGGIADGLLTLLTARRRDALVLRV